MFDERRLNEIAADEIFKHLLCSGITTWGILLEPPQCLVDEFDKRYAHWKASGFSCDLPSGFDRLIKNDTFTTGDSNQPTSIANIVYGFTPPQLSKMRIIALLSDFGFDIAGENGRYPLNAMIAHGDYSDDEVVPSILYDQSNEFDDDGYRIRSQLSSAYGDVMLSWSEMVDLFPDFDHNNPIPLIRFLSREESDHLIEYLILTTAMDDL
ncbi:MAG: hypothetical protein CMF22_11815 [Idiomarinaceae bacterium]|nr:hypothetical protein [Idiomarinaceae bacterium]|tara:strand:+ start:38793 stop:39422 length:630 start_codon:yes stop_codon:yes gene_type:complete